LSPHRLRQDSLLFGESQSRVVLSVCPAQVEAVLRIAKEVGVPEEVIGTVGGERLVVEVAADRLGPACRIDVDLDRLHDRWANSLERMLNSR